MPLDSLAQTLKNKTLSEVASTDSHRTKLCLELNEAVFDFTKCYFDSADLNTLDAFAERSQLKKAILALYSGEKINTTEGRAVTHTDCRSPEASKEAQDILSRLKDFTKAVHSGQHLGYTQKPINTIVNVGIGGSDLGPKMICEALAPYAIANIKTHFVSNVDGYAMHQTLSQCDPETTLFIVASKSFSTQETLMNAKTARAWFLDKTGAKQADLAHHFVAISCAVEAATQFGIAEANCFPMPESVGGRYSLWSAIGLSIALTLGFHHFESLLEGAHAMDEHYKNTPFDQNIPFLMGFFAWWHQKYFEAHTQAILPYDERLGSLPAYLQQLEMESLGKHVDIHGNTVSHATGQVLWGGVGTNGQHAFHQLLHQGTHCIPADFIAVKAPHHTYEAHHQTLLAHCFAQSEALMMGQTADAAYQANIAAGCDEKTAKMRATYQEIEGNKPSTTILLPQLSPFHLGQLIAAYEHKVFTLSQLYQINAFDQWGVELGKKLCGPILKNIRAKTTENLHFLTKNLVTKII